MIKNLLIAYHSQTGRTESLAFAAYGGAHDALDELNERPACVYIDMLPARKVGIDEMRRAHALIIATPENFGYMSGEIKALFDRTYDAVREGTEGRAYVLIVSAGNDGRGAVAAVERIMRGYSMTREQDPLIVRGDVTAADLEAAWALGKYMAAGLAVGLF